MVITNNNSNNDNNNNIYNDRRFTGEYITTAELVTQVITASAIEITNTEVSSIEKKSQKITLKEMLSIKMRSNSNHKQRGVVNRNHKQ